jgi:sodium-coupled neutral amino acid transporter 11
MKRHILLTTALVGAALLISLTTCNLGFVLELTGGFSATALSYILPPACYLKLSGGSLWDKNKLRHWACIAFGIVVMVLSTFHSIQKALSGNDTDAQCDL